MFNEEDNVKHTVDRIGEVLRGFTDGPWEVIAVNDGSLDRTWQVARELAASPGYSWFRIVGYAHNRGRGFALRMGFQAARGKWIVSTDADLSYDPHYILELLNVLREEEDIDLVLASAYMPGGGVEGLSMDRLLVSRLGNLMLSWFMSPGKQKVYTITCVFRAYRRHVLDNLELESEGKDIHLEILSKALMLGYRFKEVPAILKTRKKGKSKYVFGPTAASHLVFALFERPIIVFGMIGLIMMLSASAGLAYMMYGFFVLHQGITPGRPLLTMILLAFLGGIQLISFGVIGTQFVSLRKEMIKVQARLKEISSRQQG